MAKAKKTSVMAQIYGSLIVKGEKSILDVPAAIRNDVVEWLKDNGYE